MGLGMAAFRADALAAPAPPGSTPAAAASTSASEAAAAASTTASASDTTRFIFAGTIAGPTSRQGAFAPGTRPVSSWHVDSSFHAAHRAAPA